MHTGTARFVTFLLVLCMHLQDGHLKSRCPDLQEQSGVQWEQVEGSWISQYNTNPEMICYKLEISRHNDSALVVTAVIPGKSGELERYDFPCYIKGPGKCNTANIEEPDEDYEHVWRVVKLVPQKYIIGTLCDVYPNATEFHFFSEALSMEGVSLTDEEEKDIEETLKNGGIEDLQKFTEEQCSVYKN